MIWGKKEKLFLLYFYAFSSAWEAQRVGDIRAFRAILNQRLKKKSNGIHQFWKIIS